MNLLELLAASLIPTMAIVGLLIYLKKSIPKLIQNVLDDVGGQITATLKDPQVKHAMSIMGKKSGEVRADSALRERVADSVISQSPVIERVLEELDITPIEGLKLMNDPLFAPIINQVMGKLKSGQGEGSGGGLP